MQVLYSLRRRRLTGIGIPIINLRQSDNRLRFRMGIPILIRQRLLRGPDIFPKLDPTQGLTVHNSSLYSEHTSIYLYPMS